MLYVLGVITVEAGAGILVLVRRGGTDRLEKGGKNGKEQEEALSLTTSLRMKA